MCMLFNVVQIMFTGAKMDSLWALFILKQTKNTIETKEKLSSLKFSEILFLIFIYGKIEATMYSI